MSRLPEMIVSTVQLEKVKDYTIPIEQISKTTFRRRYALKASQSIKDGHLLQSLTCFVKLIPEHIT